MELKDRKYYQEQREEKCFNRTFMELKASININTPMMNRRFNRTFMELKGSVDDEYVTTTKFQSHLYGIERFVRERD